MDSRNEHPCGKADVVKSLSAKIPYSSPDHPLPCRLIPKARQATVAEHLEMSHHRIGKALNHICPPGSSGRDTDTDTHTVTDTVFRALRPAFSCNCKVWRASGTCASTSPWASCLLFADIPSLIRGRVSSLSHEEMVTQLMGVVHCACSAPALTAVLQAASTASSGLKWTCLISGFT